MVQLRSVLKVVDNSGVSKVRCIRVLGVTYRSAKTGDVLVVSVRGI
jgi:ribosomal protein L14